MRLVRLGTVLLLLAVLAAAAGCGGTGKAPAAPTVLTVRERDFAISVPTRTVARGDFVLRAENRGPDAHELIVVRLGKGALPLRSDGITVDEDAVEDETAGALEPDDPGTVRDLRVRLKPGRYVLFCNMTGHFMGGMHTTLVVR
jgi:uncharacterized cupredoxin-like copper-binding protein